MAFSVAPTSGTGPYQMSAEFYNIADLDGVNYALELRATNTEGSCDMDVSSGQNQPPGVDALLANGVYQIGAPVPSGSCRTYSLIVRDLSDGTIISSENVYLDNS